MSKRNCYQLKVKLNVTKIPAYEREANIIAIYSLLMKDDLFKDDKGEAPQIISEIKKILENIDLDNEKEISESILKIKKKIKNAPYYSSNSNVHDLLYVFSCVTNLTYKTIRSALCTANETMKNILSSYD